MKRVLSWSLLVAVSFLSACGLIASLIPDISVADLFGLDGVPVTLTASSSGSLVGQQDTATVFGGVFDETVPDVDTSDFPIDVSPSGFSEDVLLGATVTMTSPSGSDADFPDTLTVVSASLDVTLTDGSGAPSLPLAFESGTISLALNKDGACAGAPLVCTYTVSNTSIVLINIVVSGVNANTLETIFTEGGDPNTVSGSAAITLGTAIPVDTQVGVTLQTSGGTISF
ncbi:MAG: hypothetical protein JSV66_07070 [Trueperaceae bacterium]|nr:MAG: hypothetical protein JSV66_07070 [Trueperaceae bacterium]